MELRNPFGLRENKIVLIEDISKNEKGLRCNCVCPSCKEPFEARMGDVRRHHFAHSGQGCDEVNAYITGLYMLLNEYLTDGHPLCLPPVIVGFKLSAYFYITDENIEEHTWLLPKSVDEEREIQLYEKTNIRFQSSHLEISSNGKPQAIIAIASGRKLAIRITPPDTVCKLGETKKYKDYPTVEIDLSNSGDLIQQSKKSDLYQYLSEYDDIYRWIYNPRIKEAFPRIIKGSKAYYDAAQERMKNEAKTRILKTNPQCSTKASNTIRVEKLQVECVCVAGEIYAVGDMIKHQTGIGMIKEISKLINNTHEIKVCFEDGNSARFGLEVLIKNNLISKT